MKKGLDYYYYPSSVAVIGVSSNEGKAGYQIPRNLLDLGFEGPVYLVNPKLDQLFGLKCYPSLDAIPDEVELIVVTVPAFAVPEVFEQAARKGGVKAAVIIASGFSETKVPERIELEKTVLAMAREAGIRVMGPNCVGVMNTDNHLDTTFANGIRQIPGGMSFISQSGALGASALMFATNLSTPMGFAKWAHVGNQADVSVLEVMRYFCDDPATKVIAMYIEGLADAREFLNVAREVALTKPIIVMKVGRSEASAGPSASHTGSLATSDDIYEAGFAQAGIVRVNNLEELLNTAKAFSMQPLPEGNRILVLTEAGGPGIIAMDELGLSGYVEPAQLTQPTIDELKTILPPQAIVDLSPGYVDMTAAAMEDHHGKALECVLKDPNVDGIVHLCVPPTFLRNELLAEETVKGLKGATKPVTVCYMAGEPLVEARKILERESIPTFDMPEQAARVMTNMIRRSRMIKDLAEREQPAGVSFPADKIQEIGDLLSEIKSRKRNPNEPQARLILEDLGVPLPPVMLVRDGDEAVAAAENLGYPVVLKIVSPDILHKSDVGGVRVGLHSAEAVRQACAEMTDQARAARPEAVIEGLLVTRQADEGTEMIAGAKRDPQFGPVVMAGFGGVLVEVSQDMSFRVAPFGVQDAEEMLKELRLYPLLQGVRGSEARDSAAFADLLVKVGEIMSAVPEIQEIDLNPVRLYRVGFSILDARIIV